jgi:hypothetical protein
VVVDHNTVINTSGVIVKVLGSADVASNGTLRDATSPALLGHAAKLTARAAGSYAAAASAFGTVEFLNERPNVFNANKRTLS